MNIEEFGKFVHKILFVYESETKENYISCLRNRITYVSGMEGKWVNDNWLVMLKGLKNIGVDATHDEVRSVIMEIMGDLRRIKEI